MPFNEFNTFICSRNGNRTNRGKETIKGRGYLRLISVMNTIMNDMTWKIIYTFIRAKFDRAFIKLPEFLGVFVVIDLLFLEIANDLSSIKKLKNFPNFNKSSPIMLWTGLFC